MSNGLEVRLLGSPQVFYCGQPVKFAARKALALFAYLVVEKGNHPREKLQAIFWSESETRQAQFALRTTLARIKDALREVGEPLQVDSDRVGFNHSLASTLDLELVARAAAITQTAQIPPATLALLQSAVDATRSPFMDGFSLPDAPAFDEWLTIQRAHWGQSLNSIHDRLSNQQFASHLIQSAIETVNRWLVLDRLNETAYQRLMRLHFLNGDRSAALQAYETCHAVLNQELGLQLSAETEETLAYIRSGQSPAQVAESEPEAREALHIPFVGRSNEYQGLVGAFHLIKKGKPQVVVVSGESGIGKTRLADEFLKWAGTEGADVLRGRAFETTGQLLPYQPIIDALRERLERENAPEDLLDDAWLAELTRILPELRERYPDLPLASSDVSTARARLFEAIARLAEALSARHPLVWLMDDLQWTDAETLELLHYLSRNWRKGHSRILLLILMRSEAMGHGTKLRDWMSGLTRNIKVARFSLLPMPASDIQKLIQALAGGSAAGVAELSAWFITETAGQPFFLTETLTALDEYGALVWEDGKLNPLATLANLKSMDVDSLAPAIRDVVLSRLEWLSQSASSILSAAAVIGRNCSFGLLSQVSGTNEQDSLNALDELLSAGMIVEVRDEARPYVISHDRIREVVYAQLSKARKQTFHRRAAFALTEQKAPPAELANHYASAGDKEKAVEYLLKAGDQARRLYAHQESILAYQRVLAILKEMGDNEQAARILMKLGLAHHLAFDYHQARQTFDEGFTLWQRSGEDTSLLTMHPESQTLRLNWSDPPTIDPVMHADETSAEVVAQLFSGLVTLSPELDVIPAMARYWEVLEDGCKYIFHLREDARWSDGTPVTADDFVYAWRRVLHPDTKSPNAAHLFDIQGAKAFHQHEELIPEQVGIRALDSLTLAVDLESPTSYFPHMLANNAYPIPQHIVEKCGEGWAEIGNIVTNGPFKLETWQKGRSMVLVRNPYYFGSFTGNVERVELSLFPSTEWSDSLASYEADDLDILMGLPPVEMDRVRQRYAEQYITEPWLLTHYIAFNINQPPFNDIRIRRAFVQAIDLETLADVTLRGDVFPGTGGFIPPGMPGHSPGIGLRYNPDRARQLLAEAGYPNGRGFPIVEVLSRPGREHVINHLQTQWREILGVEINWETMEMDTFFEGLNQTLHSIVLNGWLADYPDPDNFLRAGPIKSYTQWQNEIYTELVEKARRVADQSERMNLYGQADKLRVEEAAIMPVFYGRQHLLVKPWVKRFPTSAIRMWFLKDVIINPH